MTTLNTNYLAPSGREEAWRFSPVKDLTTLLDANSKLAALDSYQLTKADGDVKLKSEAISSLSVSTDEAVVKLRRDVASGQILEIPKNFESSDAIRLTRVFKGNEAIGSRLQVSVGENAHAKLIIDNLGSANISEEIEFSLSSGANLTLIAIQEWNAETIQLARQHAILAKDSTFTSINVTMGGKIVRILPTVEYTGPGAFADLSGLYFATDHQHLEHRLHVDHNVAHSKSRVNYKGALSGEKARTVWIGDVYIRANAEGTDTYELNRNLLLSDGARADSVPNLEIETGEIVGAGHASTTGRFDDEQLFYLMSRGIPEADAKRLVIRGFFSEVISLIKDEEIEERLMARVDGELSKAGTF